LRIRFAPDKVGQWTCTINLVINQNETIRLGQIKFECIESASKGQIELTKEQDFRHRYLTFSDKNEMFFPVGLNLVWSRLDELKVSDHEVYQRWFVQLGEAKANYIQLSMLPFSYGIEQESLNNYTLRLPNAWEFDELLALAKQHDIYVNLLTLIHDEFLTGPGWIHKNNHWTNNIYNSAKNGGLTGAKNPADFFTDSTCKTNFRKRLRYILSRYGYSVNLPVIELLSEVDNAIPGYNGDPKLRKQFQEWFVEMKNYIHKDLGYAGKLISASYTQGDQAKDISNSVWPVADVILLHFYGRDKFTNFQNRYMKNINLFKNNPTTRYKPIIFDEMGAHVYPTLDHCSDMTFHNNLWATSFMGSYGAGMNWWWDNAILTNGYEKNIVGLRKFLEDENFTVKEFVPEAFADNKSKFKSKTAYETYVVKAVNGTKAAGWVHSTGFWWANQKNTNACMAKLIDDNNGASVDKADNTPYATEFKKQKATGDPVAKPGQQIQLKLNPSTEYLVKWYNTITGEPTGQTQQIKSSSSGKTKFAIPEINASTNPYGDLGFKVVVFSK
ncbi:MAG TPA: hypothetical protein VD905_12920, partial [Flavobacteriales bacterium]|nr:hypothetical protein [Flavobacteriales bacterium]